VAGTVAATAWNTPTTAFYNTYLYTFSFITFPQKHFMAASSSSIEIFMIFTTQKSEKVSEREIFD